MVELEDDKPKKNKPARRCDVPTCGRLITEFGHVCNYPGRPKPNE